LDIGIAFSDLKPQNIVLVKYVNKDDSENTLLKPCYRIKLIDLASFTYLKDIKGDGIDIERDWYYPKIYTPYYSK
jgi:hypothetical protein